MRLSIVPIFYFVFIAVVPTALAAEEYNIRLFFPAKAGDSYRFSTVVTQKQEIRTLVDGVRVGEKSEDFTVDLEASVTELQVNEKGRAIRRSIKLENCVITTGGEKKALAAGLLAIARRENKKTVFEIGGTPADPLISKALQLALPLNPDLPTDDEAFGTREKKSIGDSWQINAELFAQSLQELYGITAKNVSGRMKLDDVVPSGETNYLLVSGDIVIGDFSVLLPPGFTMQNGKLTARLSGRYPISPMHHQASETGQWTAEFVAKHPASDSNTKEMTIDGVIERRRTSQLEIR